MRDLNEKEKDLLFRIEDKPDLQPHFFRKAKGLHWFDPLCKKGFFSPEKNPKPIPSKEEGYVNIPAWPAVEYLVATSSELSVPGNKGYADKFLKIIWEVTDHSKRNKYGNFHTWRHFATIMSYLPADIINENNMELVAYWLDDPYDGLGLVAQEIGENWLPKLLAGDESSASLALKLLDKLFSVHFDKVTSGSNDRKKTQLRFDSCYADKIVEMVARPSGKRLGIKAVKILESKLVNVLEELKNDSWSSFWRRTIEEYEQNQSSDDAEDILIAAYLRCLLGAIESDPGSSKEYLKQLLDNRYQTLRRLAIHTISQNFDRLDDLTQYIIVEKNFSENLRHEIWNFLNRNYPDFQDDYKKAVLEIIETLKIHNDDGSVEKRRTAYSPSVWLSAIKDKDERADSLYQGYVKITGAKPERPDFSSHISARYEAGHKSPIPFDHLLSMEITKMIETINDYKDAGHFGEPSIEGLAEVFKEVVKSRAPEISLELDRFLSVDLVYISEVVEAFHELWNEKKAINWKDIWPHLLEYCEKLISDEKFWSKEKSQRMGDFLENRNWIVCTIARLIEDGTKSDDHAFEPDLLPKTKGILTSLLEKQKGKEFRQEYDAVSVAINSARGCCIKAMVNHTLRACRLMEKSHGGHLEVWQEYEPIYNAELKGNELGKYEFATLVPYYLPNFRYMSKEWVLANLPKIFDQSDHQKWLCAMQGYSFVSPVYREIYKHLMRNGDFVKALDNENFEESVQEKIIQNIVVSYINDYESLTDKDNLISVLLERKDYEELSHLIWFVWTEREKKQLDLSVKVFELWPKLLQIIDFKTKTGRKLASSLCHWAAFIDEITDVNRDWLLRIAPHAQEMNKSHYLLKDLARISLSQPLEVQKIWLKMLDNYSPDYYEESIKQILANLIAEGSEGKRKAKEIVDAYIRHGTERPRKWLMEITQQG